MYSYTPQGNISAVTDGDRQSTYQYDEINQLIRENNAYLNKTVTYSYDAGGNILSKTAYPYTTGSLEGQTGETVTYSYGDSEWKDLLTAYNGQAITYDAIGNPLNYKNGFTFTWQNGRRLATAAANGKALSFAYNESGIRTQKTVDGVTTEYYLDGSTVLAQKTGNNTVWYYYDCNGTREALEYGGQVYYYLYNAQGDVMALYDNDLNIVTEYTYDSWGKLLSVTGSLAETVGKANPFRYRGYYYDTETELYYLNSRYYDPETGRFINADSALGKIGSTQGCNMFAYSFNDPIDNADPTGNWPKLSTLFTVIAVAAVVTAAIAVTVATCGASALALAGGGLASGFSVGMAVANSALLVAKICTVAAASSAVAEKVHSERMKPRHTVYKLVDKNKKVQYVGRTKNLAARKAAHKKNPYRKQLDIQVIASDLNYYQARGLEQIAMMHYHTINTKDRMNNQINGIGSQNGFLGAYMEAGRGVAGYIENRISNEILYWTGN